MRPDNTRSRGVSGPPEEGAAAWRATAANCALLAGGVEVGATLAEGAVVGAVAAMVFPDEAALFAGGVVVVDGVGAARFQSFG